LLTKNNSKNPDTDWPIDRVILFRIEVFLSPLVGERAK